MTNEGACIFFRQCRSCMPPLPGSDQECNLLKAMAASDLCSRNILSGSLERPMWRHGLCVGLAANVSMTAEKRPSFCVMPWH